MRAVIVDDERLAVLRLQQILENWEEVEIVGTFTKYTELLHEFPRLNPDVAFLDIDMPGMNGLELATSLLELNDQVEIVFVTAYDQYALAAFRVNAIDYILKPIDEDSLARTIRKISKRMLRLPVSISEVAIRIHCFGDYTVSRSDESRPVDFPTTKAEELFAFFMVNRETNVSKWMICESLWPDHEPHKAEQNLHTTVYRMRKTLAENGINIHLSSRKGFYHFQLEESCDYVRFEELKRDLTTFLAKASVEAEQILRLYKGPLFGYKDYSWCEAAREQANQSFREMAKSLARTYMRLGNYQQAHDFLQFILSIVPYEEEVHELILRIYLRWRDRTSFLNHYNKMKETLWREMNVAPPRCIEELVHEMMKIPQ